MAKEARIEKISFFHRGHKYHIDLQNMSIYFGLIWRMQLKQNRVYREGTVQGDAVTALRQKGIDYGHKVLPKEPIWPQVQLQFAFK